MSDSFVGRKGKSYRFLDDSDSPKMKLVGNYDHPEGKLGNGASGEVWLVDIISKDGSTSEGALKVYNKRLSDHPRAERQYKTEAEFNIRDRRFIQPLQSGQITTIDGRHAILFPFVKCVQLFSYVKENEELPMEKRMDLVQHTAASISQLHNQGWLHNDIKPQNLLHVEDDSIYPLRVIDFQLACAERDVKKVYGGVSKSGRLGTEGYQAPEVLALGAKQVSKKSDIWALGCTAYYILTGREVYDRKGIVSVGDKDALMNEMQNNLDDPIINSEQMIAEGVKSNVARVLEGMLVPRMKRRTSELVVFLNHLCHAENKDCNVILHADSSDMPEAEIRKRIREEFPHWVLKNHHQTNKWIYLEIEKQRGEDPNLIVWGEKRGEFGVHVVGEVSEYTEPTPAELVRVTIIPNGKPKQYINVGRGKSMRRHVRARHFDGQDFEHQKLLQLEWDGFRLFGRGRSAVTLRGKRLKKKEIVNNDILHFDGLPTRITFDAKI